MFDMYHGNVDILVEVGLYLIATEPCSSCCTK